jgi:3-hydroxyisobutyrate dehydrogenase-like beta-hydroxyacid dehydrogenase
MDQVKRTGIVGLGAMGLQIGRHMAAKGFDVLGHDVDPAAIMRARALQLRIDSAEQVARHAEVVIVMVATDRQVRDVVHALLGRLASGAVICIASSVSPETCRELAGHAAAQSIDVLDTPMVLGQEAANNGTATIFVGGETRAFERAQPVLATFGARVLHLGDIGAGQIAKTINNMLLWACMAANFEALTLAKALGADLPKLVAALGHGSGANWSLSRWGKSTGKWAEKDMDVALDLAQAARVPALLAGLVDQLMKGINQERMKALLS